MSSDTTAGRSEDESIVVEETGAGAFQVRVVAGDSSFLVDEPREAGGLGSGPNPYDLLSAAVGACTAMTMRLYANRKGWPLERVRVKVAHDRTGPGGRDRFVREIELHGTLDDAQRARILDVSKRCPVHLTLERGSQIETVLLPDEPDLAAAERCDHARDMAEACKD